MTFLLASKIMWSVAVVATPLGVASLGYFSQRDGYRFWAIFPALSVPFFAGAFQVLHLMWEAA